MTRSKRKQSGNDVAPPAKRRTRGSSAREEATNGEAETWPTRTTVKPSSPRSPSTRKRRAATNLEGSEDIENSGDSGPEAVAESSFVATEPSGVIVKEIPQDVLPTPAPSSAEEKKAIPSPQPMIIEPAPPVALETFEAPSQSRNAMEPTVVELVQEESTSQQSTQLKSVPPAVSAQDPPLSTQQLVDQPQIIENASSGNNVATQEHDVGVTVPTMSQHASNSTCQQETKSPTEPTAAKPELTPEEIKHRITEEQVIAAAKALPLTLSDKEAAVRAAMQAVAPQMKALQQRWNTALSKLKRKSRRGSRSGVLPVLACPARTKTQVDYVLDEAKWMATDAHQERKWKVAAAKRIGIFCAQAAIARLNALGLTSDIDCSSPLPQARAWRERTFNASEQRRRRSQAPLFSSALLSSSAMIQLSRVVVALCSLALDEPQLEHIVLAPNRLLSRWRLAVSRRYSRVQVIEASSNASIESARNLGTLVIVITAAQDTLSEDSNLWAMAQRIVFVVCERGPEIQQRATSLVLNIPKNIPYFLCQLTGNNEENQPIKKMQHLVINCTANEEIRVVYERVAQAEAGCLGHKLKKKYGATEAAQALERLRMVCVTAKLNVLVAILRQLGGRVAVLGSHPEALRLARFQLNSENFTFSEEFEDGKTMTDIEEAIWLVSSRRLNWTEPVPQVDYVIIFDDDWIPRRDAAALLNRIPASCLFRLVLDTTIEYRAYQNTCTEEQQKQSQQEMIDLVSPSESEERVGDVSPSQQLADVVRAIPGVATVLESSLDLCSQGILKLANQPLDLALGLTSTGNGTDLFLGQGDDTSRLAKILRRATCRLESARLDRVAVSYNKDHDDKNNIKQRKLFYPAPKENADMKRLGYVAVPADTATFDASLARWPLVQSRTVVHAPEWLRSARVASLNRRLKYNTPTTNISRRLGTTVGRGIHTGLSSQVRPQLPPLRPPQIGVPPQHRPPLLTIASPHDKPAPAKDDDAKRARALAEAAGRLPFVDILQLAPSGLRLAWGDQASDWRRRREPESSYSLRRIYAGDTSQSALAALCVATKLRSGELSLTRQDVGPAVPPSVQRQPLVSFRDANWEQHRAANQPISIVKLSAQKPAPIQLVPRASINKQETSSYEKKDSDPSTSLVQQLEYIEVKHVKTQTTANISSESAEAMQTDDNDQIQQSDLAQLFRDKGSAPNDILLRKTSTNYDKSTRSDHFPWEEGYMLSTIVPSTVVPNKKAHVSSTQVQDREQNGAVIGPAPSHPQSSSSSKQGQDPAASMEVDSS